METYNFYAPCATTLSVSQNEGRFVLNHACPNNLPEGTLVETMIARHCLTCPIHKHPTQMVPPVQDAPIEVPKPPEVQPEVGNVQVPVASPPATTVALPLQPPVETATPPVYEIVEDFLPAVENDAQQATTLAPAIVDKKEYKEGPVLSNEIPLPDFLVPGQGEEIDIEAVIRGMPDYIGGPSSGGLSSHTMSTYQKCPRRAYYAHVMGVTKRKVPDYFAFGTLFHACLAYRYMYGAERTFEPCDVVAQAGAPGMAGDVRKLVAGQIDKFAEEEWKTWVVMGVETNLTSHIPCRVGKKTMKVPVVGRADIILGLKDALEPHPGYGKPYANGVYLGDWKTTSAATYDLITGYGMDFQFLVYDAIYALGGYADVYGPLRGTMITLAKKQKRNLSSELYQRITAPIPNSQLEEFIEGELRPLAGDFYGMLTRADRDDKSIWGQRHTQCVGRWGACPYFDLCDGQTIDTAAGLVVDPARIMDPNKWADAPRQKARSRTKVDDGEMDKHLQAYALDMVKTVEHRASTDSAYAALAKERHLQAGHTLASVVTSLTKELKEFFAPLVAQKATDELAGWQLKYLKSGVSWVDGDEKGKFTWKQLATAICTLDWFDLSKVVPPTS